jgi:hypothetical protein
MDSSLLHKQVGWKAKNQFVRTGYGHEPQRFTVVGPEYEQYYSGADVKFLFDNVLVEEVDSIGYQLAQNIRPIYNYHSHTASTWQYGTRLVQGYMQTVLTKSAYISTILSVVERNRRLGTHGLFENKTTTVDKEGVAKTVNLGIGFSATSLKEALDKIGGTQNWRAIANQYDLESFGKPEKTFGQSILPEYIDGLTLRDPGENHFLYNPYGSALRSTGFTISVIFGEIDTDAFITDRKGLKIFNNNTASIRGTIRQLHGVHIVAGPNTQIEPSGKPVNELNTFVAKDFI